MPNTWQIYQTRLAALLPEQPVPGWPPSRRVSRIRGQATPHVADSRHMSITQLVRLPGIWRPDCALVRVPVR